MTLGDVVKPVAGDGEILIQVYAAGVTPTELSWYPTRHTKDGGVRVHAIPGHEFSGVVSGLGKDVTDFSMGDAVYGMNDWFAEGATAEYCVATPSGIAVKPATLSYPEAATVPIAALTSGKAYLIERSSRPANAFWFMVGPVRWELLLFRLRSCRVPM